MTPAEIAAAARERGLGLFERLTGEADAIADSLAQQHDLVAWDREQIIGKVQRALWELQEQPHRGAPGGPEGVLVVERRQQPLECLAIAWAQLQRGRRVHVWAEPGASRVAVDFLAAEEERFGGALTTRGEPPPGLPSVGVTRAHERIGIVLDDTDRELAAYILARVSLRRAGLDPRSVKRVFVSGNLARLERHLRRLWVGTKLGPAHDTGAFAGPVAPEDASKYLALCERWSAAPGVKVLCPGGRLQVAGDHRTYLAPILLRVTWPPSDPLFALGEHDWVGPVLVVHALESAAAIDIALAEGDVPVEQRLIIGPRRRSQRGLSPDLPESQGALMLERLPPGLPDPRPV